VSDWLSRNTFHHSQFDPAALVEAKREQGVTVSLCIPTLNEERTIGKEVVVFIDELMRRHPLLDEVAVIDSGSEDQTCEVAAAFGADVYSAADILPQYGNYRGKGENLWKAIYQLRGDIVIYVDADIKNIHPRFAYGLLGPLLADPQVSYVKAFYDRPLAEASSTRPSGGGRVTEILIRPLFSLFFPELSGLIQPLSGEYAVRRGVLETLAFPIGYGVETSHLIDVYQSLGMAAFAQVDLDRRVHTNQSTSALGRMSFRILQTFLKRIGALGLVAGLPELGTQLQQFQVTGGRYERVDYEIEELERPPMVEIAEYRQARGSATSK
jgi:glucosyl-3-phosphoglycerate synthase